MAGGGKGWIPDIALGTIDVPLRDRYTSVAQVAWQGKNPGCRYPGRVPGRSERCLPAPS